MSKTLEDSIKRWTAKRKTALVIEIIQGKTTVSEASRSFDLTPSEIEGWVEDAKRGMENSLRAKAPASITSFHSALSPGCNVKVVSSWQVILRNSSMGSRLKSGSRHSMTKPSRKPQLTQPLLGTMQLTTTPHGFSERIPRGRATPLDMP
ncbi:DUF1153 domain-containing protein [Thioclava litoralis]|uniref:DUF1153 domain-containing protein n=1 Tax=Thioclava litoralis TaxID=3076557 RepID=A0ABZ1E252_9RHOB|nr:DUF1153 domain-containing protein [Thioclava sp. FTW29]